MKRAYGIFAVTVLVLGLSVYLGACGGGGGSNGPSPTPITTTTEGAQSASAGVNTAQNIMSSGGQLSNLVGTGTGATAPKIKIPWVSTKSTALSTFVARVSPVLKKSRMLATSPAASSTTYDCVSQATVTGGTVYTPDSYTVALDSTGTIFTITYNACNDPATLTGTNGVMTINVSGSNSMSFSMGSAAAPFTVTDYSDTTFSQAAAIDKSQTAVTMSLTKTGTTTITDNMTINGSFENWDYVANSHDKQVMNNLSMAFTTGIGTISYNNIPYDVYTFAINGSMTQTNYVSGSSETDSFRAFTVEDDTPSTVGSANIDYLSINGMFTISTTPSNACIEGTFSIVTNSAIQIDDTTGLTVGGQLTINSNTVVTFESGINAGSVSVTVDGGTAQTYNESQLSTMCSL